MEKQKLYVKLPNGRYAPYKEPEPPFDNVLYRKFVRGNKVCYYPISMRLEKELDEGVWVVTKQLYGKSYTSGMYLRDLFMCQKASDIQEVSLAKLGGMDKLADYLGRNYDKIDFTKSKHDICRAIVGVLFNYENEKGK